MIDPIYALIRGIADSEDDFEAEGDTIVFVHQGIEHCLKIKVLPEIGPAVNCEGKLDEWVSVREYIQDKILRLPLLAKQIGKALEKKISQRPVEFIDGPGIVKIDGNVTEAVGVKKELHDALVMPSFGTTQVIQLMAPAGQGKTVLLEHLAREFSRQYKPAENPTPLLLVVDLLGRYVGTIHDAIAGALSNDYSFPGLTGKDIIASMGERWINLALDGFDELVARVGTREAFIRTKELIDSLGGSGTIVLSARETFFELFEIDSSFRTYLQPNRGSYFIKEMHLKPWERNQVREVFISLGSASPDTDLDSLLAAFHEDKELVYRPFFATRLGKAWIEGERFKGAEGEENTIARQNFTIGVFLEREVAEKWKDREGRYLSDKNGHMEMLSAVAEEMWRSGSFSLTQEEVEIAGKIGIQELIEPPKNVDDLVKRLPTHSFLSIHGTKNLKFAHQCFYEYMLGYRLAEVIRKKQTDNLRALFNSGEISKTVMQWAVWRLQKAGNCASSIDYIVESAATTALEGHFKENTACFYGNTARMYGVSDVAITDAQFTGESLKNAHFESVRFSRCHFWTADLSGAEFKSCEFNNCEIMKVFLDSRTAFTNSSANGLKMGLLEEKDHPGYFTPQEIRRKLTEHGLIMAEDGQNAPVNLAAGRPVSSNVVKCLDKLRRLKTWDFAIEEMIDRLGEEVKDIVETGCEFNIFKPTNRDAGGPHRTFYRFAADRETVYRGQIGPTGNTEIDGFWDRLQGLFPD